MKSYLHSIVLELMPVDSYTVEATTGHQAQALFLHLIEQVEPVLSARLHDEPEYRPYTVSPLRGAREQRGLLHLNPNSSCFVRVTLMDDGVVWQQLSRCLLEVQPVTLRLGKAMFKLQRTLSTSKADITGWAGYTDWQTLASQPGRHRITLRFASPTAFSLGNRKFALFPEPLFVWDSLLRTWNKYAPDVLHIDKHVLRAYISQHVTIEEYDLHTATFHFPYSAQKGFIGMCRYVVCEEDTLLAQLATLAEFARFAGIGYKTTMGMGQSRTEDGEVSLKKE